MIEKVTHQLWQYVVNGQTFYTPSGAYATDRDSYAILIYETQHD
jgi:hypothetical protein